MRGAMAGGDKGIGIRTWLIPRSARGGERVAARASSMSNIAGRSRRDPLLLLLLLLVVSFYERRERPRARWPE